jgi:membrane protein YdbS with pleckstrin-like domain
MWEVQAMAVNMQVAAFPVDSQKLRSYMYWYHFWFWLLLALPTLGMLLPVWLVWALGVGHWYAAEFTRLFVAGLEDKRIRIHHGVVFQNRKAIPLDRITDVLISQGFLERRMGICQIRIQTAGTGAQGTYEGVIYAIPASQADAVQDQIIAARDRYSERSS